MQDAKDYALTQLGPEQYACLDWIVMHESRWDPLVHNSRGSAAYGIPQANPGERMASAGADWETNPVTQVRWMLTYLHDRYGSACAAVYFWAGWYDSNGVLHPGHGWY